MNTIESKIIELVKEYYQAFHLQKEYKKGDKINYAGRIYDEQEMINLIQSALEFYLTGNKWVNTFERDLARFLGARFTLMVNSGSSANLVAFFTLTSHLLGERAIKRGDEVITLAAGFPTTIAPIVQFGAVPVFVDIELKTHNIDVSQLDSALSKKTKAIFIAHTLGIPFDLKAVKTFCDKHNLWLIEDNCDALGARFEDKMTGMLGDLGTSSFYPAHHITTGEGGAVYTNNAKLAKIARSFRDWGRDCYCESGRDNTCGARFSTQHGSLPFGYDHKYVYSHFGFNLKATEMQAAIGVAQLQKLPEFISKRRENHEYLYEKLKHLDGFLNLPKIDKNASPFGFLINIKDSAPFTRNEIVEFLESRGIQTRNLFAGNILSQPVFETMRKDINYRVINDLKNTDIAMKNSFWIGVYPKITKKAIDFIANAFDEFIRERERENAVIERSAA